MFKRFLQTIRDSIDATLKLQCKHEVEKIAVSEGRLIKDRFSPRSPHKFRKGEIYQFEFGRNYFPEMSFEHRGLIIGVKGKLLYVLPICSYNQDEKEHRDAYHPNDNPDKKQNYYLLKSTEYGFIKRDSVMKLDDMRTISVNRKLYAHSGKLDVNTDPYKEIESLVLQKYFYKFYFDFAKLQNDYYELQTAFESVKAEKEQLEMKQNGNFGLLGGPKTQ